MKNFVKTSTVILGACILLLSSCKKDKKTDPVPAPEPIPNMEEVITTFKITFKDSATLTEKTYLFKDPDGPGGQAAYYGPSANVQSDSVIQLNANSTYYASILLMDETKSPVDTISNEVKEEGKDHMFFYNNSSNTILNAGNPYTIQINGAFIKVTYTDLDEGTPQRGIGLETQWRTHVSGAGSKFPLNITLKHQPDLKDGTYAPGESDISVDFKLLVN